MLVNGKIDINGNVNLSIDDENFEMHATSTSDALILIKEKLVELAVSSNQTVFAHIFIPNKGLKKYKATPLGKFTKCHEKVKLKPMAFVLLFAVIFGSFMLFTKVGHGKSNANLSELNSAEDIVYNFQSDTDESMNSATDNSFSLTDEPIVTVGQTVTDNFLVTKTDIPNSTDEAADKKKAKKVHKKKVKKSQSRNFSKGQNTHRSKRHIILVY